MNYKVPVLGTFFICFLYNINYSRGMLQESDIQKFTAVARHSDAGFLYINKPTGWTSHDVVAKLRNILGIKRVGHAGTLDPLATGVLIIGINQATKLLDYWHIFPKTYHATLCLGKTSNTYDSDGSVQQTSAKQVSEAELRQALSVQIGVLEQLPPPFSAKKIQGKKAYELARAGKKVTLQPKQITIFSNILLSFSYPTAELIISCSTGTYIRTIIHDIGQQLGVGAIMTKLTRTNVGSVTVGNCISLPNATKELLLKNIHTSPELLSALQAFSAKIKG